MSKNSEWVTEQIAFVVHVQEQKMLFVKVC